MREDGRRNLFSCGKASPLTKGSAGCVRLLGGKIPHRGGGKRNSSISGQKASEVLGEHVPAHCAPRKEGGSVFTPSMLIRRECGSRFPTMKGGGTKSERGGALLTAVREVSSPSDYSNLLKETKAIPMEVFSFADGEKRKKTPVRILKEEGRYCFIP